MSDLRPRQIDKIVCDWSLEYGVALTEEQQNALTDTLVSALVPPDGNIHTMPTAGPRHVEQSDCWCGPTLDFKDAKEHWVHKGYEEIEQ